MVQTSLGVYNPREPWCGCAKYMISDGSCEILRRPGTVTYMNNRRTDESNIVNSHIPDRHTDACGGFGPDETPETAAQLSLERCFCSSRTKKTSGLVHRVHPSMAHGTRHRQARTLQWQDGQSQSRYLRRETVSIIHRRSVSEPNCDCGMY